MPFNFDTLREKFRELARVYKPGATTSNTADFLEKLADAMEESWTA